jgi:hypothetical protein
MVKATDQFGQKKHTLQNLKSHHTIYHQGKAKDRQVRQTQLLMVCKATGTTEIHSVPIEVMA